MLNEKVEERFPGSEFRFSGRAGVLHSFGETYFEVQRVKGSWQTYRIEQAYGYLDHHFQVPEGREQVIQTDFRLLETGASYIQVALADIYLRYTKLMRPEFKQEVRLSATEVLYSGSVIGATKVRFFPIPIIGNTLYLVRRESDGALFPIAYAKYRIQ